MAARKTTTQLSAKRTAEVRHLLSCQELSQREIAARMGISPAALSGLIKRRGLTPRPIGRRPKERT